MSQIPTKHIQGDASVGRNGSFGGNVRVAGSTAVGRNLIVRGWADIPNLKGPRKGLFESEESLNAAYPHPEPGWWALVGDTLPAAIYRADYRDNRVEWIATGASGGNITIDCEHFNNSLDALTGELELVKISVEEAKSQSKEADVKADQAIGQSDEALRIAKEASQVATDADSAAKAAEESAEEAKGTAAVAGKNAAEAIAIAGNAVEAANAAATTAADSKDYAAKAVQTAGEAKATADEANATAIEAIRKSGQAEVAATEAKEYSEEAKATADEALSAVNEQRESIGKPGGIAPLDDTGYIPARCIPGKYDDTKIFACKALASDCRAVLEVSSHTSEDAGCMVIYDTDRRRFLLAVSSAVMTADNMPTEASSSILRQFYAYTNWADSNVWGTEDATGIIPADDKAYIDKEVSLTYIWSGADLVPTGTNLSLGYTSHTAFPGDEGVALRKRVFDAEQQIAEGEKRITHLEECAATDEEDIAVMQQSVARLSGLNIRPFKGICSAEDFPLMEGEESEHGVWFVTPPARPDTSSEIPAELTLDSPIAGMFQRCGDKEEYPMEDYVIKRSSPSGHATQRINTENLYICQGMLYFADGGSIIKFAGEDTLRHFRIVEHSAKLDAITASQWAITGRCLYKVTGGTINAAASTRTTAFLPLDRTSPIVLKGVSGIANAVVLCFYDCNGAFISYPERVLNAAKADFEITPEEFPANAVFFRACDESGTGSYSNGATLWGRAAAAAEAILACRSAVTAEAIDSAEVAQLLKELLNIDKESTQN